MKRVPVLMFLGILSLAVASCISSSSGALPTAVSTISIPTQTPLPTKTPAPTPTYSKHRSAEGLVRTVAGLMIFNQDFRVEMSFNDYYDDPFPDGRIGFDVDLSINSPGSYSREEIIQLAYSLMREFFYNFTDPVMFVTLHIRGDTVDPNCTLGLGIGYISARNFLPSNEPESFEDWYDFFVEEEYYGDLLGQTDALLAYGNDPKDMPYCTIEEWKR